EELRVTLGSNSFNISHLCHNRTCFNPEHLVVESRSNNMRRQACNGHKVLVGDDFSYHPCSHGSVEKMRKCILPVEHGQDRVTGHEMVGTEQENAKKDDDLFEIWNSAVQD
ncbi:zinc-binding loop region of homing endonuclease-domain-containing protein, partial [Lipomyces kononenkoae]